MFKLEEVENQIASLSSELCRVSVESRITIVLVVTRGLPNWLVHLAALFDPTVRLVIGQLGRRSELDTSQIRSTLDWSARPVAETIRDTADSLIAHGIV